jgi:hypothetical protein
MPQPSIITIACAYQTVARHKAQSAKKPTARAELGSVDFHALYLQRISKPAGHHSIVEQALVLSHDELGIRSDAQVAL